MPERRSFLEPNPMTQLKAVLDCRNFRKHHLSYLDDTLSGDEMATAQQHILTCTTCAAHDTMVRRSLVIARNIPTIEPSSEFQARLHEKLAQCRQERLAQQDSDDILGGARRTPSSLRLSNSWWSPRMLTAIAASAAIGTLVWQGLAPTEAPVVAMQPVIATPPAIPDLPYISPAMLQAMATGNPVFPAALAIEESPNQFVNVNYSMLLTDDR